MSLRYQINIRIFFSSLCVLSLAGIIAISQARKAVNDEVDSSINFAVQLIRIGFVHSLQNPADWLSNLGTLKKTRHLSIQLKQPSGQIQNFSHNNFTPPFEEKPPQWFIHLVEGKNQKAEYPITLANGQQLGVIIQSNPLDEITEVWQESLAFFTVFFLLTLFSFLAVNLAFHHTLKAITIIVNALKVIESGQYKQKLPEFSINEYDSIARAINELTFKLEATQLENRALTQHTLEIQEEERKRLAQELHDELGQSLSAIKVMAIAAKRFQSPLSDRNPGLETNNAIINTCDHLMSVVRSMMHQLHPLVLTELGLKASLEDLLNHWGLRNAALKISLNCDDDVNTLDPKIAIQIFRVVQECLTNSVRHAQATQASITLILEKTQLLLEVRDNGVGCLPPTNNSGNDKMGFGLLGMRERINSLGGELMINTAQNKGMSICATIPLL